MWLHNGRNGRHRSRLSLELVRRRRQCQGQSRVIDWPAERAGLEAAPAALPTWLRAEPDRQPTPLRPAGREVRSAASLEGPAWLWQLVGQAPAAREQWSELLRLALTSAERPVRAETLNLVGRFACEAGDLTLAQTFFQEALLVGRSTQESESVARSLSGLARVAIARGALDLARVLQEECLMIQRRIGQGADVARSLAILGWLTLESRGFEHAEALHEESLTIRAALGTPLPLAFSLVHLGWLDQLQGRRESARSQLAEALTIVRGCPERWKVVALLALLGRTSSVETPLRCAVQLLTTAETLETESACGTRSTDREADHVAEAWRRLDGSALASVWGGDSEADADGLIQRALCSADASALGKESVLPCRVEPTPLTPRELEVAMLIGQGHTNRRIADELVIAERTAETHARNIREKLGLTTRAQIAAWAAVRSAGLHRGSVASS